MRPSFYERDGCGFESHLGDQLFALVKDRDDVNSENAAESRVS